MLRPHGRIAFYTIHIPAGLSSRERRRAARAGPPAVTTARDYPELLHAAGFDTIGYRDVTAAYLDTARAWLHHSRQLHTGLATLEPPATFADRLTRRRETVAAIEAGLLRRALFYATRPAPPGPRDPARRRADGAGVR